MSWSCLKCCCRTLKELCIDECLHTSMTWSKGRVIQNPSTTMWQTNSVTEKATVSIICFWRGLNNMLLSFSSYIYLILRSGKDKVFFVVVVLCHKQTTLEFIWMQTKTTSSKGSQSCCFSTHQTAVIVFTSPQRNCTKSENGTGMKTFLFQPLMFLLLSAKNGFKMVQKGRIPESNS